VDDMDVLCTEPHRRRQGGRRRRGGELEGRRRLVNAVLDVRRDDPRVVQVGRRAHEFRRVVHDDPLARPVPRNQRKLRHVTHEQGPTHKCSPRHTMPFDSINEGRKRGDDELAV